MLEPPKLAPTGFQALPSKENCFIDVRRRLCVFFDWDTRDIAVPLTAAARHGGEFTFIVKAFPLMEGDGEIFSPHFENFRFAAGAQEFVLVRVKGQVNLNAERIDACLYKLDEDFRKQSAWHGASWQKGVEMRVAAEALSFVLDRAKLVETISALAGNGPMQFIARGLQRHRPFGALQLAWKPQFIDHASSGGIVDAAALKGTHGLLNLDGSVTFFEIPI
jgi:hypothetical protein